MKIGQIYLLFSARLCYLVSLTTADVFGHIFFSIKTIILTSITRTCCIYLIFIDINRDLLVNLFKSSRQHVHPHRENHHHHDIEGVTQGEEKFV